MSTLTGSELYLVTSVGIFVCLIWNNFRGVIYKVSYLKRYLQIIVLNCNLDIVGMRLLLSAEAR